MCGWPNGKRRQANRMPLENSFLNDEFAPYYNLNGVKRVFITADIDWAPDFAVDFFLQSLHDLGIRATVFATHRQHMLRNSEWLEVGLHPDNTRSDPTYGLSRKIVDLKEIYPDAVALRCHRNFFGQNIADMAVKAGLKYDISHVLWQKPYAQVFRDQWGLVRASYGWEDGLHCDYALPFDLSEVDCHSPGLKVYNFHPIFFYLNSPNDQHRRQALSGYRDLTQAKKSDIDPLVWKDKGNRDFSLSLLRHLKGIGCEFLLGAEAFAKPAP